MRSFWLFRSDIKALEYYHEFKDLQTFKKKCHDYYLLLPLWLLENDYFDEVIIWRLTKHDRPDIIFNVNGKQFIQRWVRNFNQTYDYPPPEISFWRGGFQVYDAVTKEKPKQFGLKLYLGAGKRITSKWGGKYNMYLMESEDDLKKHKGSIPFYKTASPEIFKPLETTKDWHFCWPANFTQINYKGQAFLMDVIGSCPHLKKMKFVHCGNKPEVGKKMARERGLKNIEFMGWVDREKLNEILNRSFFGLNMSNKNDGCPRVSTEILMSGTPLIIRDTARLLPFFKEGGGAIECNEKTAMRRLRDGIKARERFKKNVLHGRENIYSFEKVNKKNYELWKKI